MAATSSLARKFAHDGPGKQQLDHLKEFYLDRLAKREPRVAARLSASMHPQRATAVTRGDTAQPQASGQHLHQGSKDRPSFPSAAPAPAASSASANTVDHKLHKLRAALEDRLQDAASKANTIDLMRHFTNLRFHIDTALKWTPGCLEIGVLSQHTIVVLKQLTATSRELAPAVYIFSRRIENVVIQKDRELRRELEMKIARTGHCGTNSTASTRYTETVVSQQDCPSNVGINMQDTNEYLSQKNEDEERRWFYSKCLTLKLACPDQALARKTLISDLYARVKEEKVATKSWDAWIKMLLVPKDTLQ